MSTCLMQHIMEIIYKSQDILYTVSCLHVIVIISIKLLYSVVLNNYDWHTNLKGLEHSRKNVAGE